MKQHPEYPYVNLGFETVDDWLKAQSSGRKFGLVFEGEAPVPVTLFGAKGRSDIVCFKPSVEGCVSVWSDSGASNLKLHSSNRYLVELKTEPTLPPFKPLPFKTREELLAAWTATPHKLKFVITPDAEDAPGVYDVLSCELERNRFLVKIMISGGEASDADTPRYMPANGRHTGSSNVYLVWLDDVSASKSEVVTQIAKAQGRTIVETLKTYITPSDEPGIKRIAALPAEMKPTPAPTFAPPKTTAVAGLFTVHNPDNRHNKFGGKL
jgi:hypothetical protein